MKTLVVIIRLEIKTFKFYKAAARGGAQGTKKRLKSCLYFRDHLKMLTPPNKTYNPLITFTQRDREAEFDSGYKF